MSADPARPRFPRATALHAARDVIAALRPACEEGRIIVAGSLRRRRSEVGDVEILYIGRREIRPVPGDMFQSRPCDLADLAIRELLALEILCLRPGVTGSTTFGPQNKLVTHVDTGVPVDLFATCETSWYNYLVCRTGPKSSNQIIAARARDLGWQWHPYGSGFTRPDGSASHDVTSERDLFDFLKLPWQDPWERGSAQSKR